uniref:Gem-associated protein 2 (Trinotate prediction) n=1 Tax=Myxobolus squamalis TaxID=59785 RepID=A0A6B2G067_MYXSQ
MNEWYTFIFNTGNEIPDLNEKSKIPKQPKFCLLCSFKQIHVIYLLSYFSEWLELSYNSIMNVWIYALLVVLETPLQDETCFILRHLFKIISNVAMNKYTNEECKNGLHMISHIIVKYFKKTDQAF